MLGLTTSHHPVSETTDTVSEHRVYLDESLVPMALHDLHHTLDVGSAGQVGLLGRTASDEHSFKRWCGELLPCLLTGAGLATEGMDTRWRDGEGPQLWMRVRRVETLADTVGPGMRLLLVGLNPSPHATASGVGFSGPSNRGWPALLRSGLATADRDPISLLYEHRIGMTDIVKRTTRRASELLDEEYRAGISRLERLCSWLQPGAVCVVGLSGWRAAVDHRASPGRQQRTIGGRPVWLMPNPSGLNAHVTLDELAQHLEAARCLADGPDGRRGP